LLHDRELHHRLILQLAGRASWTLGASTATLDPGDLLLIAPDCVSGLECGAAHQHLCLHIPAAALESLAPSRRWWSNRPATGGAAAVLGSLIRSALEHGHSLDGHHNAAVRDSILRLMASVWGIPPADHCESLAPVDEPALIRRVKTYAEVHLSEPSLSPSRVADIEGISVRHLHRLFGATGESFSNWVRKSRLASCAADLRNAALAGTSVTRIAFRWGFNDSAHFSRAFLTEYGCTPSEYRSRHLGVASLARRAARHDRAAGRAGSPSSLSSP
jgi:AraC-like DNA-binding protein